MSSVLDEILTHKRVEVERAKRDRPVDELRRMPAMAVRPRNFFGAVTTPRGRPNLIAEVKAASPSAGVIREDFDPVAIARTYRDARAAALSVLTDEKFFRGHLSYIEPIKAAVGLPVLRKDFILDPYQVVESRAFGADAVLLIAEALRADTPDGLRLLRELIDAAIDLEMAVLLEIHAESSLLAVLQIPDLASRSAVLLGVNNRDLHTQTIDLAVTERLAARVFPALPLVSESGIRTSGDVRRVARAGACAVLVGEALMRERDPAAAVRELFDGV